MYVKVDVNNPANDALFQGKINFDLEYTTETNATETLGIAKVGDIIERGEYPQTFVGAELNQTLVNAKDSLHATGRTFTTYQDSPSGISVLKEYSYNNERYVMLERASFYQSGILSTGESFGSSDEDFINGSILFFKVEPIKFKVMELDYENGEMTLWSDMILFSMWFDLGNIGWSGSSVRFYLNNTFRNDSELKYNAKQVTNENSRSGEYYENNGTPTQDQIWIPAVTDFIEWYPSENITVDNTYDILIKKPTDFAIATYCYANGIYWLRNEGGAQTQVEVLSDGSFATSSYHNFSSYYIGLCPAIVTEY